MFGRFKDQVRRLADVARGVPTIEQLVTDEIERVRCSVEIGELSPHTLKLYTRIAPRVIEQWGAMRPGDLTVDMLRADMLTARPRSQWNIWMAFLGRVLTRAHDMRIIAVKPRLPRFPDRNREARILPDEYPRVVEVLHEMLGERGRSASDPSTCRSLLLCLYTGCRLNESRTLRWECVHLDLRIIRCGRVKRQEARYGLCEPACQMLRETPRVGPYCFPSTRDASKPISRMHHTWAKVRVRAQLQQHVTIHGMRHSWTTSAAAAGGTLAQIGKALNHSHERMTARYSHLAIGEVLPLVDRVGAVIGGSSDDA